MLKDIHPENEHNHRHVNTKTVINRLSRVDGHIRAIKRMLEEDRLHPASMNLYTARTISSLLHRR
jgi:hypothetical protein